jgi:hypothetical protein
MQVWIVADEGTFIDEINIDMVPKPGEQLITDRKYRVVKTPAPNENSKKFNAQVLVVKEA